MSFRRLDPSAISPLCGRSFRKPPHQIQPRASSCKPLNRRVLPVNADRKLAQPKPTCANDGNSGHTQRRLVAAVAGEALQGC